jgi:hypothetical protein
MRKLFPLLLILVFAVVIVLGARYSVRSLEDGLVLWLPFDEGTGNVTHDLLGHNGVIHGVPKYVDGMHGGALEFNGTGDFVKLPKNISALNTSIGSLCFWIYPNSTQGYMGLIHFRKVSYRDYIIFRIDRGLLRIYAEVNNTSTLAVTSQGKIAPNAWNHIAVVQNGEGVKVFINGFEQRLSGLNSGEWFGPHFPAKSDFSIGHAGSWKYYYNGKMDDIRIYNRSLTIEEVKGVIEGRSRAVIGGQSGKNMAILIGGLVVIVFLFAIYQVNYGKKL